MGKENYIMIGILCAMEVEMGILRDSIQNYEEPKIQGIKFYQGQIESNQVVICIAGIGKVHAAMATSILIEFFECSLIINTGIAGGITGVESKDIILASELKYSDVDVTPFGYAYGQIPAMPPSFVPSMMYRIQTKRILNSLDLKYKEATIYTGDFFVRKLSQLKHVNTAIPCVAEMEGAAVAQVCTKAGIDYIVLRYVSDIIGNPNQIKDYQEFEADMAKRSSYICLEILRNLE